MNLFQQLCIIWGIIAGNQMCAIYRDLIKIRRGAMHVILFLSNQK